MSKAKNATAPRIGDRVKVQTNDGERTGIIQEFDGTTRLGKFLVKLDDNSVYEVPVGIGWPDDWQD